MSLCPDILCEVGGGCRRPLHCWAKRMRRAMDEHLINQWILVTPQEGGRTFMTEKAARQYQLKLAEKGVSSQLFHERHVLLKEPVTFMRGVESPVVPNDPEGADHD